MWKRLKAVKYRTNERHKNCPSNIPENDNGLFRIQGRANPSDKWKGFDKSQDKLYSVLTKCAGADRTCLCSILDMGI